MKSEVYTLDNEVFMNFIFYGTLILIKTVIMSNVTSFFRVKNNAYCSVEDAKIAAPNSPEKQKQFLRRNEDVERVSSCCDQGYIVLLAAYAVCLMRFPA